MLSRDYEGVPPSAGPPVYPKQRGIHPIGHLQWNWMLSIIDDGAVSLVKLQKLKKKQLVLTMQKSMSSKVNVSVCV